MTVAAKNKPAFLDYCVSKTRKFEKCVVRGTTLTNAAVDFTAKVKAGPQATQSDTVHV